jgi:hypothetical protein
MKPAISEMDSAIAEREKASSETISATSEMKLETSKMILEDGFGAKNGKKPGFSRAAGTDLCANFDGTG